MKRISVIILTGLFAVILASCNSYLDVTPKDRRTTEQIYNNELGTNSALNGIYMYLTNDQVYGAYLSSTVVEVLGQRYNVSDNRSPFYTVGTFAKDDAAYKNYFSNLWKYAYTAILNINGFIQEVSSYDGVVSQDKKNILLGEAYGLRAFIHLDLLRLYGPIYGNDSLTNAIPYRTTWDPNTPSEILPANEVMNHIMADLKTAEGLLANDPIITQGTLNSLTNDPYVDFYHYRGQRFNYYAVKAAQARALLYRANKPAAYAVAQQILTAPLISTGKLFAWSDHTKVTDVDGDKVFSSEVIFGLFNSALYTNYTRYFSDALLDTNILAPFKERLNVAYGGTASSDEVAQKDYRYQSAWSLGTKTYKTFIKYKAPTNLTAEKVKDYRYLQPLLRISEIYYIAAECSATVPEAVGYLNAVRANRGLGDLATTISTSTLNTEIDNEYTKEFYGEGQIFFHYKRKMKTSIPSGATTSSGNKTMSIVSGVTLYQIPLPEDELKF